MTFDEHDRLHCPHCGYIRPDEISGMDAIAAQLKTKKPQPHIEILFKGEISPNALAAFDTGHDYLYRGQRTEAIAAFQRAAEYQPDFFDVYLWIAKTTTDIPTRREALNTVLAQAPTCIEAQQMMMVLNGALTPEEAARIAGGQAPEIKKIAQTDATSAVLLCPQCGGQLTVHEDGRVICRFCGYQAAKPQAAPNQEVLLSMALLKRKGQKVLWNVGVRTVHCQQCGAVQTLPPEDLSTRCRFCGSTQVILKDALDSFEQPASLIPFVLAQQAAGDAIQRHLEGFTQKLAHWLGVPDRLEGIEGLYLPFWVFNVTLEIIRIRVMYSLGVPDESRSSTLDTVNYLPILAVKSIPMELIAPISHYDMTGAQPYDPRWLAKYPAQLYQIDFDRASLDAREVASRLMHEKYPSDTERPDYSQRQKKVESIHQYSQIQNMTFDLMLLPVWIGRLGGKRIALVNGQTGKVTTGSRP
jgi:hypothetical protein